MIGVAWVVIHYQKVAAKWVTSFKLNCWQHVTRRTPVEPASQSARERTRPVNKVTVNDRLTNGLQVATLAHCLAALASLKWSSSSVRSCCPLLMNGILKTLYKMVSLFVVFGFRFYSGLTDQRANRKM